MKGIEEGLQAMKITVLDKNTGLTGMEYRSDRYDQTALTFDDPRIRALRKLTTR